MKVNKYPDGTSYVEVLSENDKTIRVNTYEDLHHLEQYVEAYNFKYKKKPNITLPNLIDAQADRRFTDNQSSGLKIVLKRLNSMQANFKIFHPHNPEVVEAASNNIEIINNEIFITNVLLNRLIDCPSILKDGINNDNLILMSSDAGGFKPLIKLADSINWRGETFSASKSRSWDKTNGTKFVQQIDRNDFNGKDILIIDDISVYGGTFKGLAKLLKERNVGKVYLAVSHITVQDLGEDPVTNYFDKVFTTNSKFDEYFSNNLNPKNLEILKLFKI